MKKDNNILKKILKPELSLIGLMIVVYIFFGVTKPAFATVYNFMTILKTASYMAIMVAGMTWVIAANEMDCAFPDIAACSSMVFAWCIFKGFGMWPSIAVALFSGILAGSVTSILVVKFKFHSLITTIAVSTICGSVASAINGGMPLTASGIKSSIVYDIVNAKIGQMPVIFLIALGIYIVLFVIQEKTKFGQYIYALGENRQGVEEAGIKVNKILAIIFITSAAFAALAGIILVLLVYGSGQPSIGSSFFLDGFTVVFLGAMVLKLGKTNVVGSFLGSILLVMVTNGLTMMGSSYAVGQIVKGILLVIGIVIVALSQRKQRGKVGVLKYE